MRAFGLSKVVGFYLAMLAVGCCALWVRGGVAASVPPAALAAWSTAIGMGLGVGILIVVASRWCMLRYAWARLLADELRCAIGELNSREAVVLATLSGLSEEVLFRGVLQPALGLGLASMVFGLLHLGPNRRFLPWTLMACLAGLIFGLMYLWTGNLVAPVLAHVVVNALNLRHIAGEQAEIEIHVGPAGGERAVRS